MLGDWLTAPTVDEEQSAFTHNRIRFGNRAPLRISAEDTNAPPLSIESHPRTEGYAKFFRSLLASAHANRVFSHYFASCCELGLIELGEGSSAAVRRVAGHIKQLRRGGGGYAAGYAELLDAALGFRAGDQDACLARLERAVATLEREGVPLVAASARYRLGTLIDGDEGAALRSQADETLTQAGVVRPSRYIHTFTPGFGQPL